MKVAYENACARKIQSAYQIRKARRKVSEVIHTSSFVLALQAYADVWHHCVYSLARAQVGKLREKVQNAAARKLQGAWRIKVARRKVSESLRLAN